MVGFGKLSAAVTGALLGGCAEAPAPAREAKADPLVLAGQQAIAAFSQCVRASASHQAAPDRQLVAELAFAACQTEEKRIRLVTAAFRADLRVIEALIIRLKTDLKAEITMR